MAESLILTGEEEDETTEKDKKKFRKRSDSSSKIGASVLEKGPARSAEQSKMSPLDKILASLLPEKESKTKQNAKAEGIFAELGKPKSEAEIVNIAELIKPTRELTSDELSGGEVIINLRTEDLPDTDDGELVIALQTSSGESAPDDEPEAPEDPIQATSARAVLKPTGAGGSGGGRTPPPSRPTMSSPPPPRNTPVTPVMSTPVSGSRANVNTAPAPGATLNQLLDQRRAVEQAEYYARRHGRAEGFLGGVILGGLVEHFRHKSRERKMERLTKQESQKQEKQLMGMDFQLKTEQLKQVRIEEAAKYERKAAAKQELATVARAQMSEAEAMKYAREVTHTAEEQERNKAALIERLNAQAALQEQSEAEMLANSENHIEESAWHSIEVDKAGHAVQDTNIEYGHEYYQERGHESGPKDVTTRDSMTGAAALTAVTTAQPAQAFQQSNSTAPPMIGLPMQPATNRSDDTYSADSQDVGTTGGAPHTSAAAIILLLVTLAVVGLLIFVLV